MQKVPALYEKALTASEGEGSGWFDDEGQVRAANRNAGDPTITANDDIGFRCAK